MIGMLDQPTSPGGTTSRPRAGRESAADITVAALDAAGAELRGAYGEPKDWTWGSVHQATFREPTLGSSGIGPLEWYFNKGPVQVGGAAGAVDNTYYRPDRAYPDPDDPSYVPVGIDGLFEVTNLPSYRLLVDMGDLDGARIVSDDRPERHPVRPPLRRPDRRVGDGRDGPAVLHRAAVATATAREAAATSCPSRSRRPSATGAPAHVCRDSRRPRHATPR